MTISCKQLRHCSLEIELEVESGEAVTAKGPIEGRTLQPTCSTGIQGGATVIKASAIAAVQSRSIPPLSGNDSIET